MKKIFALIFATIFAGTLFCACGENDDIDWQKYVIFQSGAGLGGNVPKFDENELLARKNFALGLYYKKLNDWLAERFSSETFFTERDLRSRVFSTLLIVSASDFEKMPYDYWDLLVQTAAEAYSNGQGENVDDVSILTAVYKTPSREELESLVEKSFSHFEQKMAEIENEKFHILRRH